MSKKLYPLAIICALAAAAAIAGCGSNSEDVAKAIKASQGSATLIAKQAAAQVQYMRQKATNLATNYQMSMILGERKAGTLATCTGFSVDSGVCTADCAADMSSLTANCTFSGQSYSCGGETFVFSDGTMSLSLAVNSASQSFSFDMNMATNVKGGDLDGKIECRLKFSFNYNNPPADDSISCSDFNCSYDGDSIDCEDLQEEFGGSC
jgi:hypothetical protein